MTEQEREREEGGRVALRLGTGRRAQCALRWQIRQPSCSAFPSYFPSYFPSSPPFFPFPPPPCLCPSRCQSQIDSGKDMENYESVGVEQIELDIVES